MAKQYGLTKRGDDQVEVIGSDVLDLPATTVDIDERKHSRIGWFIVLFGVLGFFLWAGLAPLDQGVPASGTVMVSGNRQAVQNLVGGVIEQILVREGTTVKQGDVVIRMNETEMRSSAEAMRGDYYSALAIEARLIAERDQHDKLSFSDVLMAASSDPRAQGAMSLQQQLFESRRLALASELQAMERSKAALRAQITGLEATVSSRKQQSGYLREQLSGMRGLARDGYVPRNRLLDLERDWSQVNGELAQATSGIVQAQQQIGELESRMAQRRQQYQQEVRTQLTDTQREAQSLRTRIEYADFQLAHTAVRAPASGVVVGLQVFTNGGVIAPGTQLMDIVPEDEPLMVEARVPVHLIDKVYPGLPVEMMFTALNQRTTPHIPGEVRTISADRLEDERSGDPYYLMQAQVTEDGEKMLESFDIRPGMPVEVLVKTGERSLLNYLLKPFLDRASMSLVQE